MWSFGQDFDLTHTDNEARVLTTTPQRLYASDLTIMKTLTEL